MRIGALAERTGTSVRSIRYYEQQGLLAATRTPSGQRVYAEEAVDRVVLIRRLFQAGLTSRTMVDLLPCLTDPRVRTPWLTRRLGEERDRILARIAQLTGTVEALESVMADFRPPEV